MCSLPLQGVMSTNGRTQYLPVSILDLCQLLSLYTFALCQKYVRSIIMRLQVYKVNSRQHLCMPSTPRLSAPALWKPEGKLPRYQGIAGTYPGDVTTSLPTSTMHWSLHCTGSPAVQYIQAVRDQQLALNVPGLYKVDMQVRPA
jgi:hypothetical protein